MFLPRDAKLAWLIIPTFILIYKTMVKSHIDTSKNCCSVWAGHPIYNYLYRKSALENVQKRATKILPPPRHLTYPDRHYITFTYSLIKETWQKRHDNQLVTASILISRKHVRRRRQYCVKPWIWMRNVSKAYHSLFQQFLTTDVQSIQNFMPMHFVAFDDLLCRVEARLIKLAFRLIHFVLSAKQ